MKFFLINVEMEVFFPILAFFTPVIKGYFFSFRSCNCRILRL